MIEKLVKVNFIYPEITPEHYIFGSEQLVGTVLRPNGDWRDYTPPPELQNKNGVESAACYKEAQQHTIATIQEEQYGLLDQNYSGRFNDQPRATPNGGSPLNAADSIRNDGLIPDSMLPFSDDITSWQEFNSFKGADEIECIRTGHAWLQEWEPSYDLVITRDLPVQTKYDRLRYALKYSPCPVSVYGWVQDDQGNYIKPVGAQDQHLVELVFIDENNCPYIWDTYPPFLKKLSPFYDFDFGLRWSIEKKSVSSIKKNWLEELIQNMIKFIKDIFTQKVHA